MWERLASLSEEVAGAADSRPRERRDDRQVRSHRGKPLGIERRRQGRLRGIPGSFMQLRLFSAQGFQEWAI